MNQQREPWQTVFNILIYLYTGGVFDTDNENSYTENISMTRGTP
jgi:hypothetical protein